MDEDKYFKNNPVVRYLEKLIKQNGYDPSFINATYDHCQYLVDVNEDAIGSRSELCDILLSKMFLDKMDLYPTKHFKCQVNENSDWPVQPLPSELFGELHDENERRKLFYYCLKVGDILDCRVSTILPTEYHMRVIHKYGVPRVLDDLQLKVVLYRITSELSILQRELNLCELVRVAVTKINKGDNEFKILVTVDPKNMSLNLSESLPKLGDIRESELPSYCLNTPDTEKYSSYSDYLKCKLQFQNPHYHKEILTHFGINPKGSYSYYPKFNKETCSEDFNGEALKNKSKQTDAKRLANSALNELKNKNYPQSLTCIKEALRVCPDNDAFKSKLYEIKADIYEQKEAPAFTFDTWTNLEFALKINPDDAAIRKKFSKFLFLGAHKHYKRAEFKEAYEAFEQCLKFDKHNHDAAKYVDFIKRKHAVSLVNLEEKSLLDLHEVKKQLLTQLKKMDS